ncbi:MAG TPA: hypothetical protein VJW20_13570 [Candidatus Angelobacter sp.]|nr:hypothetical protein [Candidatus Angelobacter sp.]
MKVDIEIIFTLVQVFGKANKLTILNKSVIDPGAEQQLMFLRDKGPFLIKNSDVQSTNDQITLVNRASKRYEELWKQGFFKLESSPETTFTPEDWQVSRVEVNTQPSVYPAGTQQFPNNITILIDSK